MKVKFWVATVNGGDGSAHPVFFNSEAAAEKYLEKDEERFCDDISFRTLEFNDEGNLITPNPEPYSY